jgi:hypothetical protein
MSDINELDDSTSLDLYETTTDIEPESDPSLSTNVYSDISQRALELLQTPQDCIPKISDEEMTFGEVCEFVATDVNHREVETIIKIQGQSVYHGLNIEVVDPETGFQTLIYTKSLDQKSIPEGITTTDRTLTIDDLRVTTNGAIAAYIDNDPLAPEKLSIYVVKGKGYLDIEIQGDNIGRIISPGLGETPSIHMAEINRIDHYISKYAKISPEGDLTLTTEDGEPLLEKPEVMEEILRTTIAQPGNNNDFQSCSLLTILENSRTASNSELLLAIMALILIHNRLK